jgi:hypothetical protein
VNNKEIILTPWWQWWSNPLFGLQPGHLEKTSIGKSLGDVFTYDEISKIKLELAIPDVPPDISEIVNHGNGLAAIALDEELLEGGVALLAFTTEMHDVQGLTQLWMTRFGIEKKQQIKELLMKAKEIETQLGWLNSLISDACEKSRQKDSVASRIRSVIYLYFRLIDSKIEARYRLNVDNDFVVALGDLDMVDTKIKNSFVLLTADHIQSISRLVENRIKLPVVDFESLIQGIDENA